MMGRRVVVTGLGMVAAPGNTLEKAWQETLAGRAGTRLIEAFDTTAFAVKVAAEVRGFDLGGLLPVKDVPRTSRFVQLAVSAADQAWQDAGLGSLLDGKAGGNHAPRSSNDFSSEARNLWGCSIGVGMGALDEIEKNAHILANKGPRRVSPFFLPYAIPNMATGLVSNLFGLRGPNLCPTTACTSGTHAVGEGYRYIQDGRADLMVCGGSEAVICPLGITSFQSMKALSTHSETPERASRPFDARRDGFVMGEGSGLLVLEELEHAKKRGARIYAEVAGYGVSGDAHHISAPAPEHEGGQRSMQAALKDARIHPDQVDYINAHGTSTKLNDELESVAIGKVFGDHARKLAISSTKGVTGHCLGAAGGIEAVFTVQSIAKKLIPPTANWSERDPACPWDYVAEAREQPVNYALSNSFGFGGTNGTLVFKRLS